VKSHDYSRFEAALEAEERVMLDRFRVSDKRSPLSCVHHSDSNMCPLCSHTKTYTSNPLSRIEPSYSPIMPAKTVAEAGAPALKRLAGASKACSVQVMSLLMSHHPLDTHSRMSLRSLSPMESVLVLRIWTCQRECASGSSRHSRSVFK
jgi:hypothetical protein